MRNRALSVAAGAGWWVGLAILLGFAILPVVWMAYTSLRPESDIILDATNPFASRLTLDNYLAVLTQTDFARLVLNSLVVALLSVLLTLVVASFAAYSLARGSFRGRGAVLGLFLAVQVVPGVLILIPLFIVLQQLKLLDTHLGLALTYTTFTLPAAIWLLKGFFEALPADLENAAMVDGCTRIGALFRIVLPLLRPGILASATYVAIAAWNDFMFALLLTSTNASRTWPVGLKLLIGDFQMPWGQLTAATVLSAIPVVIAFSFAGRAMVSGLVAGGLRE